MVVSCPTREPKETTNKKVLNRKRPPMLNLRASPTVVSWSETPEKETEVFEAKEEGYFSVYCKRGRGKPMEDRYFASVKQDKEGYIKTDGPVLFGVFDGHGGSKAAEFTAMNLGNNIEAAMAQGCEIERAIKEGYIKTDEEFLKEGLNGGTCCVTALVFKGELVVSNAGDCRAVLSRGGTAEALTTDHNPSQENERKRIETLGGYVDCCNGVWRIQGTLAVSRGIGDQYLKEWVIAEPETRILRIKPECEFLILASDGLWDKVTNQEAVDLVRPDCIGVTKPRTLGACKKLAELSVKSGSLDDINWGNPEGIMCALETTPIINMSFNVRTDYTLFSEVGTDYRLFPLVQNITKSLKVPIHFLNITALSEYRKDADTSVYTIKQGKLLTKEQQNDPATFADCIHWCLPGLPDTWNELVYTYIVTQR